MTFRLFFTDIDMSAATYAERKSKLTTYEYADLDDALGRARQIKAYGGVPWEIEGDDGTVVLRDEIDKLLRDRDNELVGRPKVY